MGPRDYLNQNFRLEVPEWLAKFDPRDTDEVQGLVRSFLSSRVVFYPGSGQDGSPVQLFNVAGTAHCFLYVDYMMTRDAVEDELQHHGFRGYSPIARLAVAESDMGANGWTPHLRPDEVRYQFEPVSPYAFLEILEKRDDAVAGASRLAILFLAADGHAAYDALGRKLTERVKGSNLVTTALTQFSYDLAGRLECTAVRMNPAAYGTLPASACTLGTAGTAGEDRITRSVYASDDRVVQVRKAVGTAVEAADTTYKYTLGGKVEEVIDANGNRSRYQYDALDRLQRWYFPVTARYSGYDASSQTTALATAGAYNPGDYEEYGYDANGNRTSLRKRDGSVFSYQYDALNRMTVKVVPERAGLPATHTRDVHYAYDLRGLMTKARFDTLSGEGVTMSYNGFGRLNSSSLTMDGVSRTLLHAFDANGNRGTLAYPDGAQVIYGYDGLNRPTSILRSGTATLASYGYDAAGRRTAFNQGFTTSYGYDTAGRLTTLTNNLAASAYNNQYTFSYNPAGQITQVARSNDTFAWTAHVNVDRAYTANGLNQYIAAGAASFGYDANGNLTSDGATAFTYDAENRLVAASGAKTAGLRYDPLGRLYEVSGPAGTTRFLYDGDALIGEYDSAGNLLRRYVHGADSAADDPLAWYEGSAFTDSAERLLRSDWQGSIVVVANRPGSTVLAVNRYDEYGIPQSTNAGRFQYTGQAWLPELGMYHYKARMYSPTLGRFMQTDPIGYSDGINWYAYVGNDPVNKIDPTGLRECIDPRDGAKIICVDAPSQISPSGLAWTQIQVTFGDAGRTPMRQPQRRQSPCERALAQDGKIEYTGTTSSLVLLAGLTGTTGIWRNVKTGSHGNYRSVGGGLGLGLGVTQDYGFARSLADFVGYAETAGGGLSIGPVGGSYSWTQNSTGQTVAQGGALGYSPPGPSIAGVSATATAGETSISQCHVHGQ